MHQNIDAKNPLRYLAENGINLGFWNFPSLVKKKRKYFKIFKKKINKYEFKTIYNDAHYISFCVLRLTYRNFTFVNIHSCEME